MNTTTDSQARSAGTMPELLALLARYQSGEIDAENFLQLVAERHPDHVGQARLICRLQDSFSVGSGPNSR